MIIFLLVCDCTWIVDRNCGKIRLCSGVYEFLSTDKQHEESRNDRVQTGEEKEKHPW